MQIKISNGSYKFSPVQKILKPDNSCCYIWDAVDSIVLKYIAESIKSRESHLFSKSCVSVKNHGGLKKAIDFVADNLKTHKFIFRTDVLKFYANINHKILLKKLKRFCKDNEYKIIKSHLTHMLIYNAEYFEVKEKGISLSSPLSPVLGAIYMTEFDEHMESLDIKYIRYANDWMILSKTRGKLKNAIKKCKKHLAKLKFLCHHDKTDYRNFQNPKARSFDFVGFNFKTNTTTKNKETKNQNGIVLKVRSDTKVRFFIKIRELLEQIVMIDNMRYYNPKRKSSLRLRTTKKLCQLCKGHHGWAKGVIGDSSRGQA